MNEENGPFNGVATVSPVTTSEGGFARESASLEVVMATNDTNTHTFDKQGTADSNVAVQLTTKEGDGQDATEPSKPADWVMVIGAGDGIQPYYWDRANGLTTYRSTDMKDHFKTISQGEEGDFRKGR